MEKIFKRLLLYWAAATVMVLFTTRPHDAQGGIMSILQSEQLYQVLAEGFYYGAIVFAIMHFVERRKERQEEEKTAAAVAAPAVPGADSTADHPDEQDDPGEAHADLEETEVIEPEALPPARRSRDT